MYRFSTITKYFNYVRSILILLPILAAMHFANSGANAATFTVTTVADSGAGSLRQAIINANATISVTTNVINFNIAGGVVKTVNLLSALPDSTRDVIIDGTTMAGYAGTPLFELNGTSAGASANGLTNARGVMTVRALIINRFGGDGIRSICPTCTGGSSIDVNELSVTGSYIGTDKTGASASPNGGNGIYYQPFRPSKTTIGGNLANERNVISGNLKNGILLRRSDDNFDSASYADIAIINCYIGVNIAGTTAIGNTLNGIATEDVASAGQGLIVYVGSDLNGIFGSPQTSAGDRNVISGNGANGIFSGIQQTLFDIKNSYIGTNAGGTADLGNTLDGVNISGSVNLTVGGAAAIEANVISGNNAYGIETSNDGSYIQGNRIGTSANGLVAIGNTLDGVRVLGASSFVGGSNVGEGNLISGNKNGITLEATADNARIEGNKIGTNISITGSIGNSANGITVKSSGVGIGFANNAPSVNVIGANGGNGIAISGSSNLVSIYNNLIGVNSIGTAFANSGSGILVQGCATNIRVGADAAIAGAANTIAFNGGKGVSISNVCLSLPTTMTTVRRNSIYSNFLLGIDLGLDGINANDFGDGDSGPNGLQNYPVFIKASPTQIYGTFNSQPNQTYLVDIFQNPTCSFSGNGEGKNILGTINLTTNASGNATYNLTGFPISIGQNIAATATDSLGNTSEFSPCLAVTNSPGNVAFNVSASSSLENSGVAAISVDRINGTSGTVTVDYATSDGTAIAGQDYSTTTGTITFLNGENIKTIFVPITPDTQDEPAETFNVTLSNPTGGAFLNSPSVHVLTINDDDPPPTVSIANTSVVEGNQGTSTLTFNVTQSAVSGFTTSVNFATANGTATAGIDYLATSGTVTFAPGELVKTASVTVNTDLVPELDETVLVNLSSPVNLTIANGQGTGTILDDDNPGKIAFAFATYSVSEGSPNAVVTLTRTNGSAGTVAVNYATVNGTATAGIDYTAVSGTAIFNDGQTSTSFSVPILPDSIGEANETILVSLNSPLGGAALGTLTSAVLTIFDDDGGLPPSVSIGGQIVENSLPLQGVVVTLNGSQVATAVTDAAGNYAFAGLPSAGNFLITPTLTGHVFEPQSLSYVNLTANIPNANFVGSTGAPSRNLHVISNSTTSGQNVTVAVDLTSQGNENSVGFSLGYNASLAFNPQVSLGSDASAGSLVVNSASPGRLGVIVALPAGQSFAAGSRQIVKITFSTVPTLLFSTPLAFSDSPITRMITDTNASGLPVSFSDGLIGFSQGFEADVASRPAGDGFLAVDDFVQVGRFVAGLDVPDSPVATNEFQRADCSPRGTKGDGILAVDDFTQAGRYAAGLDAGQKAGGATGPLGFAALAMLNDPLFVNLPNVARDVHVVSSSTSAGSQVLVSVEMDANGDENGIGFSVSYDPQKLAHPLVSAGSGAQGTFLIPNTNTVGTVGVIIAFAPGSTIAAGTKQLVTIRFDVAGTAAAGPTLLTMTDTPVIRRVSNVNAVPLASTFTSGSLNILGPSAADVAVAGRVQTSDGRGIRDVRMTITDPNGVSRSALTGSFGYFRFDDIETGQTYVITISSKRYQFASESQIVNVGDEITDLIFTAVPD